jgi:hypothetical protein
VIVPTGVANFFRSRWNGQVPWSVLLWRDMLAVGTAVNVGATLLAVAAAIAGAPFAVAVLLHFSPLPYNLFLFAALHRLPQRPEFAVLVAAAWLIAVLIV